MNVVAAFGRILARAALFRAFRRSPIAVAIIAALIGFALMYGGTARAQTYPCSHSAGVPQSNCETQGEAYAAAHAAATQRGQTNGWVACVRHTPSSKLYEADAVPAGYCPTWNFNNPLRRTYVVQCRPGEEWNPASNSCALPECPGGSIRMQNGQCSPTPEECEQRNGPGFGVQTTKPFQSHCIAGCTLAMTGGGTGCTVVQGAGGNNTQLCNGEFNWTGAVCGATPPPVFIPGYETVQQAADNTPQYCNPLAGGSHDYCVKSNGDHCMTSAQGRQLCWKPGETGTKTDGPVMQVRDAGTTPNVPNLNLPSGDTLQATGQTATSTTTRPGGGGSTTTTTTNYTTVHGTNAGPKNQGEKGDGSGDDKEQDPDKNTASGGEDCDRKPIVSDPAFEMIANQAWATRCAVEAGNAADVVGDIEKCDQPFTVNGDNANAVKLRAMRAQICGTATRVVGDVSDCKSAFSVQGDTPDAHQLRAMRTQICGDEGVEWDAIGEAVAAVDATAGEGDPSSVMRDIGGGDGEGELDTSGLGYGRSCPTLPSISVMGTTLDFNVHAGAMCRWMQLAGQLVLVLAALVSLRIIAT
ncbi:hypothetical protein PQS31_00065 [Luteimonas sp BLCC-B24]|uniref:hypothetical protein n=1 Tax=Luteimonas sp. BLCC-B24 TaxID=3025317 RepID=UPI00234D905D|nr:hypothetical protein [Luteimonas sp. BLCC-B24]MDC7805225.1 hypothetical protein [Luteimonas sp. BLCC-B24]